MSSWHPYSDLLYLKCGKPFDGEQETKEMKRITTLGAEKKRNDLINGQEKTDDKHSLTH